MIPIKSIATILILAAIIAGLTVLLRVAGADEKAMAGFREATGTLSVSVAINMPAGMVVDLGSPAGPSNSPSVGPDPAGAVSPSLDGLPLHEWTRVLAGRVEDAFGLDVEDRVQVHEGN
jgi:hypothetical protein